MNYPVEQSIRSLFPFSSEIVVCDTSDQEDGTTSLLSALKEDFEVNHGGTFKIVRNPECDYTKPNFGIYDGQNKAYARSHCTGDYCCQIDADEVFEDVPNIKDKIENLISKLDKDNPVISSLVLEPWGSNGKIRLDINSWKERFSINDPNITHGIPLSHRKYINGLLYSHPGSDGCNKIWKTTGQPIPCLNFVTQQSEDIRRKAISDLQYVPIYENWINKIVNKLPVIHHYSWYSVYQKMIKYKLFWAVSWNSLYGPDLLKSKDWNPFFNKPFKQVTDEEMITTARQIESETSGHIFHSEYVPGISTKTNGMKVLAVKPYSMIEWCENNKTP
jgi:hypothetical protein